ncbi:hypothetical protein TREES_T100016636 [Tupaia chinensis]|uniref:Uncharacterized protein n=1 Tax=Tupaia chinensis TaxID=246437 RepID=L9L735_TUPCH|nr:hypothetical protein TREES_T100016636 [Tupaia chinensis]
MRTGKTTCLKLLCIYFNGSSSLDVFSLQSLHWPSNKLHAYGNLNSTRQHVVHPTHTQLRNDSVMYHVATYAGYTHYPPRHSKSQVPSKQRSRKWNGQRLVSLVIDRGCIRSNQLNCLSNL